MKIFLKRWWDVGVFWLLLGLAWWRFEWVKANGGAREVRFQQWDGRVWQEQVYRTNPTVVYIEWKTNLLEVTSQVKTGRLW